LIQTGIHHSILLYRQESLPIAPATVDGAGRGERSTMNNSQIAANYDVLVIGGGAAGLSGALVLGRSRRSVLVIDAGAPRNAPAAAMHNFLSRDGMNPLDLLELGRAEVRGYGGQVVEGRVRSARRAQAGFSVTLEDGRFFAGRRLLVTTGLVEQLPDVPGLRERWGRDVIHCPYCHGWEVRDQALGVLASGPMAVHQALLFRQLTSDVVLFTHTGPALSDEHAEQLAARNIRVIDGRVAGLEITDDQLTGIRMTDGTVVPRQALVVGAPMVARAEVLVSLGLQPKPHPMGMGELIPADAAGLTDLPGVWVAGNVTDLSATVIGAAAQGVAAAAAINADLVAEDTRRAVNVRRDPGAAMEQPAGADGHDHVPPTKGSARRSASKPTAPRGTAAGPLRVDAVEIRGSLLN
jgi:thioredoxin reductase